MFFSTSDLVMMSIGNAIFKKATDFECDKSDIIIRKIPFSNSNIFSN